MSKPEKFNPKKYGEDNVRRHMPGTSLRADYGKSRAAAIRLFCTGCQGEQASAVKNCTSYRCPLWPYRTGRHTPLPKEVGKIVLPTKEQLAKWKRKNTASNLPNAKKST